MCSAMACMYYVLYVEKLLKDSYCNIRLMFGENPSSSVVC